MKAQNERYPRKSKPLSLRFLLGAVLAIGLLLAPMMLLAQPPSPPRNIAFFGRVEAVDADRKVVTVKHGKIPDYMDAATTEYSTDEDAILKRVQPGDDIRATIHPDDLTLHNLQIVYRRTQKQ